MSTICSLFFQISILTMNNWIFRQRQSKWSFIQNRIINLLLISEIPLNHWAYYSVKQTILFSYKETISKYYDVIIININKSNLYKRLPEEVIYFQVEITIINNAKSNLLSESSLIVWLSMS